VLDDGGIEIQLLTGTEKFLLHNAKTSSRIRAVSYPIAFGDSFQAIRAQDTNLTTPIHVAPKLRPVFPHTNSRRDSEFSTGTILLLNGTYEVSEVVRFQLDAVSDLKSSCAMRSFETLHD